MTETGRRTEITVDLTHDAGLDEPWLIRLVTEPSDPKAQSVVLIRAGAARQLTAALIAAATQAERLDLRLDTPAPTG